MSKVEQSLRALLSRVESGAFDVPPGAAKAPYRENFMAISGDAFPQDVVGLRDLALDAYNGSLDAALALHEAVLSGYFWEVCKVGVAEVQKVSEWPNGGKFEAASNLGNPARAWLIAILKALIAEAEK